MGPGFLSRAWRKFLSRATARGVRALRLPEVGPPHIGDWDLRLPVPLWKVQADASWRLTGPRAARASRFNCRCAEQIGRFMLWERGAALYEEVVGACRV